MTKICDFFHEIMVKFGRGREKLREKHMKTGPPEHGLGKIHRKHRKGAKSELGEGSVELTLGWIGLK